MGAAQGHGGKRLVNAGLAQRIWKELVGGGLIDLEKAEKAKESTPERKSKSSKKAPCVYEVYDEVFHKKMQGYPAVNCGYHCSSCGWNPEIAQKRVEKMQAELVARKKVKRC